MNYYVYILANWTNNVLYIGMINNLERRIFEHFHKVAEGFTKQYNVNKLVYFEMTNDVHSAIEREKQLKAWRREKKDRLIQQMNPQWRDLAENWYGEDSSAALRFARNDI